MKKFSLFLFLLSASWNVFSQTQVSLTFIAKDAQSQSDLILDSISIKNVTENCDTVLITETPDVPVSLTFENVLWPVGINENKEISSGGLVMKQNYPNPSRGATTINIYKKYSGPINLVLSDGSGRQLVTYKNQLEKGFHSFLISTSINGIIILTVSDKTNNKSIKIINSSQGQASTNIQYLGQSPDFEKGTLKSSENLGFTFYLGNEMTFTAHAYGYIDQTITDNPISDSTYSFIMNVLNIPDLYTFSVTGITQTTAICGGNVMSDGGETVTARGVCWNTTGSPTTSDSKTEDGAGTGFFDSNLSGLTANTPYFVRAYATNNSGTAYGDEVSFTTAMPLLTTEEAINDTLLYCYSKLYDYNEFLYILDAVYSNTIQAPDASWVDLYNHNQSAENEKVLMLWSEAFDIIYKANLVIQSSEIVINDLQIKNQIIAQAKAIRAYLYYNLLNWFGEVPIEGGTAESIIPRNSIDELLAFIEQDATEASLSLPVNWSVPDNFRMPQNFAKALLSRAFLYAKSYNEALNPTQQIINSGMYALSADTNHFTSASTEILWGFEKRDNTVFNDFYTKGSYVPVIRYTESFLISAEAFYKIGNSASALNYLNALNARRGNPAITFITPDELFNQWNTELINEGNMFLTLKRFDKAISIVGMTHKLVLPVPMSFIISNVNLTQNPGY